MSIRREDATQLRFGSTIENASTAADRAFRSRGGPALRLTRNGVIFAVWALIGAGVLSYAAALIYVNVAVVEVDSAIVSGTVQPLRAPAAGVISTPLRPGDAYHPGDQLFTVQSPDLDQAVALAAIGVERARDDLHLSEALRDAEVARRDNYLSSTRNQLAKLTDEVVALQTVDRSASSEADITSKMFAQRLTTQLRLDQALQASGEAHERLAHARSLQAEQQGLLQGLMVGTGHGLNEDIVRVADTEAAAERAKAEVSLTEKTLQVLIDRRAALTVTARRPGRMLRELRLDGSQVIAGETVALTEQEDDRLIYAFLTQQEIKCIGVGDEAEVVLPGYGLAARAKVTALERSGGYLDDVESRYRWNLFRDAGDRYTDRDRTARVTLQFQNQDMSAARRVDLGTPAVVSFDRHCGSGPLTTAFQRLADTK
jgi:hypothetical protein